MFDEASFGRAQTLGGNLKLDRFTLKKRISQVRSAGQVRSTVRPGQIRPRTCLPGAGSDPTIHGYLLDTRNTPHIKHKSSQVRHKNEKNVNIPATIII